MVVILYKRKRTSTNYLDETRPGKVEYRKRVTVMSIGREVVVYLDTLEWSKRGIYIHILA